MIYKRFHELTEEERNDVLQRLENGESVDGIKQNEETGKLTIPFIHPLCQCDKCNVFNQLEQGLQVSMSEP